MSIALVFDGYVRNIESIGLNTFIAFTIASATELPASTILTLILDRWGRRWLGLGTMVLCGCCSIIASFLPIGKFILFKIKTLTKIIVHARHNFHRFYYHRSIFCKLFLQHWDAICR